jgi:UDP:flavonoid glycosyltransferase YjiC (YdhE family)
MRTCQGDTWAVSIATFRKKHVIMRILFSGTPGYGHLLPLLPLARAFRQQGDEVAFTTGDSFAALFAAEEMTLLPAGPALETLLGEFIQQTGADPSAEVPPELIAEFFGGIRVDATYGQALTGARSWEPDLIVSEVYDFVGPLLAAELKVPAAVVAIAPPFGPEFDALTAKVVSSRYTDRGLTPSEPRWLLDTWPSLLQADSWEEPQRRLALRPEAHRSAGWQPSGGQAAPKNRPTVLVSFGTLHSAPAVISPILRELAKQDVDIKTTLGPFSRADYELDTEKVTFVEFTPLAELLQGVDVLVGNGGAGTTLGALAEGVPLVTVPLAADQFLIAERVAASGAGIALPDGAGNPEKVAEAVADVLSETPYRGEVKKVASHIAGLASPQDIASQLKAAVRR